jgi:hypothetical protein
LDRQRLPEETMMPFRVKPHRVGVCAALISLASCGGGSGNGVLDNNATINNPPLNGGQWLSFAYFQRCVNPVLNARIANAGSSTTSTCSSGGCHDNVTGAGGALRLVGAAPVVSLVQSMDALRSSEIYKNYFSSLGLSRLGAPEQSAMLNKPLVRGVLHGGGVIFSNTNDAGAKTIAYWINRPMPPGQDEFSSAANTMFTPPDPSTGACNIE